MPILILWYKLKSVEHNVGFKPRQIGKFDNNNYHIIIYLIALLLPFYRQDIIEIRELSATLSALAIIVFIFWRLDLYYLNLYFVIRGYNVFTIHPPDNAGVHSDSNNWILITSRSNLQVGESLNVHRISNTVYWKRNNASARF